MKYHKPDRFKFWYFQRVHISASNFEGSIPGLYPARSRKLLVEEPPQSCLFGYTGVMFQRLPFVYTKALHLSTVVPCFFMYADVRL